MPLTLVTGPANAEKARVVLDALQLVADREPLLVVPTRADVLAYRRELAGRGLVFGADVQTWSGLARAMSRAAGVRGRPVSGLSRERVAALAVQRTPLRVLGTSARTPGFGGTLLALFDELGEQRLTPQRWYAAMRAWAAAEPARADYAEDLGALFAAYHRSLQTLGRVDEPMRTVLVHDALRTQPARWPGRPVFLYGFDDLDALQVDAVETLAIRCAADVMVSLPYEAGREAFAGRAGTYLDLMDLGAREVVLEAADTHYAPASRRVLHHLERSLLELDPPRLRDTEGALMLLQGGGERAELELVAAHVARLLRSGTPAGEIAIVMRRPESQAPLVERVLGGYDIPFTLRRTLPLGHTALGRGLLALARCALLDGSADDLLVWLRTPGLVRDTARVDALEADVRRQGLTSAAQARARWEQGPWKLDELDRLRAAARRGPRALCDRLAADATRLFTGPHRGTAALLGVAQQHEARVAAQLRAALTELGALADTDPELVPAPAELLALLAALEVDAGAGIPEDAPGGAVVVADPLAIRARRVRALFVCGLQEGTFPAPGRPEAFLPDAERRAVNAAGGLRLPLREDALGAERYLFYAAVSRPTELLALSWHDATDDGRPSVRSLLVDDVLDLFTPEAVAGVQRRPLGAAGFGGPADPRTPGGGEAVLGPPPPPPTAHVAALGRAEAAAGGAPEAIGPLRDPAVLASLAARATWSASALETWVACPVRWFVERLLSPEPLLPDPEPMVRGELAHKVLEKALGALREGGDATGPLRPEHLPRARALALAALREHADAHRISPDPQRLAAALHRLQADILRYLEYAAHAGSQYAPAHFELKFGGPSDDLPPVALTPELSLQGRVDRVDLSADGTRAVVYDYKGATATARARWEADGRLQLPLYLLALGQLLGVEVDGGLYQPLSGQDPRPRGLLREGGDPDLDCVKADRADDAAFADALATARATALGAIGELRAGRLEPRPQTCGWRDGGCSYPSICRCEAA